MSVIDLGEESVIKVKWRGVEYPLREPTVREVEKFKVESEKNPEKVYDFIEMLGFPEGMLLDLPASKARRLMDGLIGVLTEKK